MKRIIRMSIFKKIFIVMLVGFVIVNAFHVYIDYHLTINEVKSNLWSFDRIFDYEIKNLSSTYNRHYNELNADEYDKLITQLRDKYSLTNNLMLLDKNYNIVKDYTTHERFSVHFPELLDMDDFAEVKYNLSYELVSDDIIDAVNNYIMKSSDCSNIPVEYSISNNNCTYLKIGDTVIFDYGTLGEITTSSLERYESYDLGCERFYGSYQVNYTVISYQQIREDVRKNAIYCNYYNDSNSVFRGIDGYDNAFVENDNIYHYRIYPILKSGFKYNEDKEYSHSDIEGYFLVYTYSDKGIPMILDEVIYSKSLVYGGTVVVTIVICFIVSHMLSRRIKTIDKSTRKITNGDFDVRLNDCSNDEIGTLSKNINIMSAKIKDTIDELNNELEHVKKLEGMKSEFIANFTHEIKTPLSIINGYIELIDDCKDDVKEKEYLLAINKEIDHINDLVLSMLNLSRLQSHNIELNIEEIDIDELITATVDSFDSLIKKKNIKIIVESDSSKILGDYKELTTVMNNFISNAIKHTVDQGSINIKVKDCILFIENEGSHIDEKDMNKIWDTYVSSDREGTGLGLAINKAILDLHGFKYNVYNTNIGVCFEVKCKRGG